MKAFRALHFQVLAGIVLGIALGFFFPHAGESMKPLGDGFIKLIRMVIAPIIFCTVVVGIASVGDMQKLGRIGLKALGYFEVVSTLSLAIGLVVVMVFKPGAGINATAATLDANRLPLMPRRTRPSIRWIFCSISFPIRWSARLRAAKFCRCC